VVPASGLVTLEVDTPLIGAGVSLMRGGHRSWEPATALADDAAR